MSKDSGGTSHDRDDAAQHGGDDARAYRAHESVLLAETLELLALRPGDRVLDATSGAAGHGIAFLRAVSPGGFLLALDRDPEAVRASRRRLESAGAAARFEVRRAPFSSLLDAARDAGLDACDAVFFDLGVSSHHLDEPARGFSFDRDGPLDMRFDPSAGRSAADLVAEAPVDELRRILRELGEEPRAASIARALVDERARGVIDSTGKLAAIVRRAAPGGRVVKTLARVFQALRMAVNDELGELERALPAALELAAPGGRIGVLTFHSLEAQVVKRHMRNWEGQCSCPPGMPVCACSPRRVARMITKRAVEPSLEEVSRNPRATSARLRVATKHGTPFSD